VNLMMPVGPEALIVQSKIDARVELAEFLRLEYGRSDARAVVAGILLAAEAPRARRPMGERLVRWARRQFGRDAVPLEAKRAAGGAGPLGAPLAAMPAARAGLRPEEGAPCLSAVPALGRN